MITTASNKSGPARALGTEILRKKSPPKNLETNIAGENKLKACAASTLRDDDFIMRNRRF